MSDWIPEEEFDNTEYGKLNNQLAGKNYFGKLVREKLPPNSIIIPDPKDGFFGIIKDAHGNAVGKVDLV
jgi:hypothetical protein